MRQILKTGKQPLALEVVGGRCYDEVPDGGPEWGLRFQTLVPVPKEMNIQT